MLTRRKFLLSSAIGLGGLAFRSLQRWEAGSGEIARVTIRKISVYSKPSDKSQILYQRYRDELVNLFEEIISEDGPGYNPLWYRVWGGYVHSAYLQRVKVRYNPVVTDFPVQSGQLAEVTVPFTQTLRYV